MTVEGSLTDAREKMSKAIAHLKEEMGSIRTGRASPALLSRITVDYYGATVPLQQLASIVEGKMNAFYEDNVLLDQPFVKDDSKTVQQLLDEVSARVGEKVAVRRFVRYKLGEDTD